MPFNRQTRDELLEQVIGDIEADIDGADARTSEGPFNVFATIWALTNYDMYSYLDWIADQWSVEKAEEDWLERFATRYGIQRQPGAFAAGYVTMSGTSGAPIDAGAILRRADGREYVVDEASEIDGGGAATVAVTAVLSGAAGDTATGIALTFLAPIDDVELAATVAGSGITGGVDGESDDSLRARVIDHIQQPPHGGNEHDYVKWAREVSGVTRAWCDPLALGPGTVAVRFMMDVRYPDGIPLEADLSAVAAHIELVRPATADVRVLAPVARPLNVTIRGVQPDEATVRAAIEAELADLVLRESAPGVTLRITHIREAISTAAGEVDHELISPTANVSHLAGEIPVMGVVVWE